MDYTKITHASVTHVMGTLTEPVAVTESTYSYGQYVYLHPHAEEHNPLAAEECMIEEVIDLQHIVVRPCNSDTLFTVPVERISAPIAS